MDAAQVRSGLLAIEDVVKSREFNEWREEFVAKHLHEFEYGEENKLVYTEIHREYEEGVERQISAGLPSSFDMATFQKELPAYLETEGLRDEKTGKAVTLLLEVGDFGQFREMMMFSKRQKEEEKEGETNDMAGLQADGRQVTDVGVSVTEMMDMCAALAEAANAPSSSGAGAGSGAVSEWVEVLSNSWMKIEKMKVPEARRKKKNDIYLKGVWTMDLSMKEACDMMFSLEPRRKTWDTNFTSVSFPCGGSAADDDVVTSVALDFGFLVNLTMFGDRRGTQLVARNIRRWDVPTRGSVTYAMYPWSLKESRLDAEHKLLSLKTGTIAPHPTNPDKIVMTTLEINGMGAMPQWALHWMMRAVAPSMMKGLETRYIAAVRKSNSTVDVTPRGFGAPSGRGRGEGKEGEGKEGEGKEGEGKSSHK